MPLAIELAAARTKVLPPAVLRAQLEHGMGLLTGGPRDQPERLQTLRGAIAWSYDLLPAAEQAAFRRLAIFSGGFSLEAAEHVSDEMARRQGGKTARSTHDSRITTLDLVESLIDSSLIRQEEPPGGDARFGMLETIRAFGLEMLAASGERDVDSGSARGLVPGLGRAGGARYGANTDHVAEPA